MKTQFLYCLFLPVLLSAQDTLIFKNGDKKTVTLKEITGNEVKYTRHDQNEGPVYIIYKDELVFIKYISGKTDSLNSQASTVVNIAVEALPKIKMEGNYLYRNGRAIDDFELKQLIDNYPYPETKKSMLVKYQNMEKYRRKHKLSKSLITVGWILPIVGLVSSGVLVFSEPFASDLPDVVFATGFGLGVVTVATGITFTVINKKKKNNERFDISILYNEMR